MLTFASDDLACCITGMETIRVAIVATLEAINSRHPSLSLSFCVCRSGLCVCIYGKKNHFVVLIDIVAVKAGLILNRITLFTHVDY